MATPFQVGFSRFQNQRSPSVCVPNSPPPPTTDADPKLRAAAASAWRGSTVPWAPLRYWIHSSPQTLGTRLEPNPRVQQGVLETKEAGDWKVWERRGEAADGQNLSKLENIQGWKWKRTAPDHLAEGRIDFSLQWIGAKKLPHLSHSI